MNLHWLIAGRAGHTGAQQQGLECAAALLLAVALLATGCKPPPPSTSAGTPPSPEAASTSPQGSPASSSQPTPAASAGQPKTKPNAVQPGAEADVTDTAYRLSPETVTRITAAASKTPIRPLPAKADTSRSFSLWKTTANFWQRIFVDGFRSQQQIDAALVPQAEKFLEGYCLRISGSEEAPPLEELVTEGQSLFQARKNDPYVGLAYAAVLADSSQRGTPQFAEVLEALKPPYQDGRQSPWLTARYHRLLAGLGSGAGAVGRPPAAVTSEQRQHLKLLIESLVQAGADPALTNVQRQMLVYLLDSWASRYPDDAFRDVVVAKLREPHQVDPWVSDVLLTRHYIAAGWKARGSGLGDTVTSEGWRQLAVELGKARFHAVRAWEKHPELPEGATEMISITMANHGVPGVEERFWFDEAVQADLVAPGAYAKYAWSLRPRWRGSHAQMLALAREALDTGRFDTEVPFVFHQIVSDVASERSDWESLIREPGVYAGYVQLFEGYERAEKTEVWRIRQRSRLAAVAWHAGKKAETRRILASLGEAADPSAFQMFGLSLSVVAQQVKEKSTSRPPYFADQSAGATAMAWLPGGKVLVQGTDQGEIAVWDAATRQRQQLLKEHASAVKSCLLSGDGQRLVSASEDGKINFWNVSDWKLAGTINVPPPLHAIAVSADGSRLAVSHGSGAEAEVVVYDSAAKKPLETLAMAGPPIFPLAIDPQGGRVFFSPQPPPGKDQVLVWTLAERTAQGRDSQLRGKVTAWQASADGQKLVAGVTRAGNVLGKVTTIHLLALLDAGSGAVLAELHHLPGRALSVAFHPDGERVVATTEDGGLLVWNPGGANPSSCVRTGLDGLAMVAVTADGSQAAAADSDGQVHVLPLTLETAGWKIETPLLETRLRGFVRKLWMTPDGKCLVVDAPLGELSLWDWESGLRTCKQAFHFPSVTYHVDLFPDHQRVLCRITAGNRIASRIIDTSSGAVLDSPRGGSYVAVSPAGNYFALAGGDVSLFAGDDYHPFAWGKLPADKDIELVVFATDGTAVVSASRYGNIKWFDLPAKPNLNTPTPQPRATFSTTRPPPYTLAISPDKTMVASGRDAVDILDAQNARVLCSVPGKLVAFSPDSQRILVGGLPASPAAAAIHEARTGRLVAKLQIQRGVEITTMTFSPDGRIALTGDEKGFVRAWDAASGAPLGEVPSPAASR